MPWTHIHALSDGSVYTCCMIPPISENKMGNISEEPILNVFNNEKYRNIRYQMLNGEFPKMCAGCYKSEKMGISSFRQANNKKYIDNIVTSIESTAADGYIPEHKIKFSYWDIRFSNLCNLKCRICSHRWSSSWYEDASVLSEIGATDEVPESKFIYIAEDFESIFSEVKDKINDVLEINFAGGEPMLMREQWAIIDELALRKNFDVKISYQTNMTVLAYKNRDIVPIWAKFPNINVRMSLDGFGNNAEYMRHGTIWSTVEKNIKKVKKQAPNVRLEVGCTVSMLNLLHLSDFYRYMVQSNLVDSDKFFLGRYMGEYYQLSNLPREVLQTAYLDIENLISTMTSPAMIYSKNDFIALLMDINNAIENNTYMTPACVKSVQYIKKLDHLRDECIFNHMPELKFYYKEIYYE